MNLNRCEMIGLLQLLSANIGCTTRDFTVQMGSTSFTINLAAALWHSAIFPCVIFPRLAMENELDMVVWLQIWLVECCICEHFMKLPVTYTVCIFIRFSKASPDSWTRCPVSLDQRPVNVNMQLHNVRRIHLMTAALSPFGDSMEFENASYVIMN